MLPQRTQCHLIFSTKSRMVPIKNEFFPSSKMFQTLCPKLPDCPKYPYPSIVEHSIWSHTWSDASYIRRALHRIADFGYRKQKKGKQATASESQLSPRHYLIQIVHAASYY